MKRQQIFVSIFFLLLRLAHVRLDPYPLSYKRVRIHDITSHKCSHKHLIIYSTGKMCPSVHNARWSLDIFFFWHKELSFVSTLHAQCPCSSHWTLYVQRIPNTFRIRYCQSRYHLRYRIECVYWNERHALQHLFLDGLGIRPSLLSSPVGPSLRTHSPSFDKERLQEANNSMWWQNGYLNPILFAVIFITTLVEWFMTHS